MALTEDPGRSALPMDRATSMPAAPRLRFSYRQKGLRGLSHSYGFSTRGWPVSGTTEKLIAGRKGLICGAVTFLGG